MYNDPESSIVVNNTVNHSIIRAATLISGSIVFTLVALAGIWFGFIENSHTIMAMGIFIIVVIFYNLNRLSKIGAKNE